MGKTIVLSRTDSIGDVILTLPMAGIVKENHPGSKIIFLGRRYTKPIIECCKHVDQFMDWEAIEILSEQDQIEHIRSWSADAFIHVFPNKTLAKVVKKSGIPTRIGTSRRLYHLLTCNQKVSFSRKKSDLHEAQLNTKLLYPLGIKEDFSLTQLSDFYGFSPQKHSNSKWQNLLSDKKFNLILHPKSQGSAVEWGIDNFITLAQNLPQDQFNIFFTGTESEGSLFKDLIPKQSNIFDLSGQMSLSELISFIDGSDGLVAASTGPLHITAALGKHAIGLYSPRRPIHPGRWKPIGPNAKYFVFNEGCENCKGKDKNCLCIQKIEPKVIQNHLQNLKKIR